MSDWVERLARKHCPRCQNIEAGFPGVIGCRCETTAAAIQAALEEAEKIIRGHATRIAEADPGKKWPTKATAGDVGLLMALAVEIAALREGRRE